MKYLGAIVGAALGKWIAYQWIVFELAYRNSPWIENGGGNVAQAILGAHDVRNRFMVSVWTTLVPAVLGVAIAAGVPKPPEYSGRPARAQGATALVVALSLTLVWACWAGFRG